MCLLIHLSHASGCIKKKKRTNYLTEHKYASVFLELKQILKKTILHDESASANHAKGVALLCFVAVATQFWQTPRAGDRLGLKERWFNTAAMGNQLSNSKA